MIIKKQKITIVQIRGPPKQDINHELQWLGNSPGLFGLRDKDRSCYRIFVELLKAARRNIPLSSDELAFNLHLTRGTVVHHLNKLMESGIIIHEGRGYILRVANLQQLIDELEKDMTRTCNNLKRVAKNIDEELGL
ncbi:MAG: ArsR family transcriptional regulator [Nanoarchaeota archaeon]|nr:ArsR family transcriptional regulator [Nanoarchaeota archaeon]